jgi:hypothetical protein
MTPVPFRDWPQEHPLTHKGPSFYVAPQQVYLHGVGAPVRRHDVNHHCGCVFAVTELTLSPADLYEHTNVYCISALREGYHVTSTNGSRKYMFPNCCMMSTHY